jgi:DnaJ-class molecular chaperone
MEATKDWPSILQFETGATITEAEVEKHYRQVAKKAHPDTGGSNEEMTQVNLAKQIALDWITKERAKVAAREQEARFWATQQQHANAAMQQMNWASLANNAYAQQAGSGLGQFGGLGNFAADRSPEAKVSWVRNLFRSGR